MAGRLSFSKGGGGGGTSGTGGSSSGSSGGGSGLRPRSWVIGILASLLVSGVQAVQLRLTSVVDSVFGAYRTAFRSAGLALDGAFATAGQAVLDAQAAINQVMARTAADAGFGGPLVVAILFAVGAALTFAALRALLNGVKWVT